MSEHSASESRAWLPGEWAAVLVQYVEERNSRALVRLPNGSKTSLDPADLSDTIVKFSRDQGRTPDALGPGDIYEDCRYHPVLCTYRDGDEIGGISLIDGTRPRACSIGHCGVVPMSIAEVVEAADEAQSKRHHRDP